MAIMVAIMPRSAEGIPHGGVVTEVDVHPQEIESRMIHALDAYNKVIGALSAQQ